MTTFIHKIKDFKPITYKNNPPFGTVQVPIMLSAYLSRKNPHPEETLLEDLHPLSLHPFSSVLHYGQSVFEGLKAYHLPAPQKYGLFRPDLHAKRLVQSAKIMSMPIMNEDYILSSFKEFTKTCQSYIPELEGHSLYLRPLLIGIDPVIKVKPSENYLYLIMGSIVGNYFSQGALATSSKILIGENFVRAFPGGTGEAKTSSNYSQSLFALDHAMKLGYDQVLYLDSQTKSKIEELGGMNFFWVKDQKIFTPKLTGQILRGVTRTSILELAPSLGIEAFEADMTLKDLLQGHATGEITEVFASGTAAIITPIAEIGILQPDQTIKTLAFSASTLSLKLREALVATQKGLTSFSNKWLMQ